MLFAKSKKKKKSSYLLHYLLYNNTSYMHLQYLHMTIAAVTSDFISTPLYLWKQ